MKTLERLLINGSARWRLLVFWVLFAAVYSPVTWWSATLLGSFDNQISLWYPVAGLRLFVLLLFGWAALLPVILTDMALSLWLAYYLLPERLWLSLFFSVLSSPLIYCGAALVLRAWVSWPRQSLRTHSFFAPVYIARFIGVTMLACGLAAIAGVSNLVYFGQIPADQYGDALLMWWLGDFIGVITVTPVLMVHLRPRIYTWLRSPADWKAPRIDSSFNHFSAFAVFLGAILTVIVLFQMPVWMDLNPMLRPFLLLLMLVPLGLAAFVGEPPLATVLVLAITCLLQVLMAWQGITADAVYYQLVIIAAALTGLMLGALSAAAHQAYTQLDDLHRITHDLLWDIETQGRLMRLSGALMLGVKPKIGQWWRRSVQHIPCADRERLRTALVSQQPFQGLHLAVDHAHKGRRWLQIKGLPYYDELGRLAGYQGVAIDITERQRAEQATIAQQAAETANRSKSAFLAHMSHEIRTPLNAIIGFTHLLAADTTLTGQQRDHMRTIDRNARHLLDLLNDVLDFARIESGRMVVYDHGFDLHTVLNDLHQLFLPRARAKGLALILEYDQTLPRYLTADLGKLRQVLINLLSNAVKFTATGQVTLRAGVTSARVWFDVIDTGPGIAAADQATIFDAFWQTAATQYVGGSGLGLAICRELATLMGGQVILQRSNEQGSCFRFDLPLKSASHATVDSAACAPTGASIEPETVPSSPLRRDDLTVLSPQQRDMMREALAAGDMNAFKHQISLIATIHEPLARALKPLAAQYNYRELNALFKP